MGLQIILMETPATTTYVPLNKQQLENLSRGGKRLIGFSRTNLFKRLESSGHVFIQSVELAHFAKLYLHPCNCKYDKPLPIGTQNAEMLDSRLYDEDADAPEVSRPIPFDDEAEDTEEKFDETSSQFTSYTTDAFKEEADRKSIISTQRNSIHRFRWIRPDLFRRSLRKDLTDDADALLEVLGQYGTWNVEKDAKLNALEDLLNSKPSRG